MHHDGHIHVYINDKILESIYCLNSGYDKDGNESNEYTNPYDLIDELKLKYNITELKKIEGPNWR